MVCATLDATQQHVRATREREGRNCTYFVVVDAVAGVAVSGCQRNYPMRQRAKNSGLKGRWAGMKRAFSKVSPPPKSFNAPPNLLESGV